MSAENGLVSGAFIFNKAYEYGWEPEHDEIESRAFDWDEEIVVGGGAPQEPKPEADVPTEPAEQLIAYFEAVYKPSDTVYIANRTSDDGEKAWVDGYSENVGTLIDGLKKCNGDIGAVLGDPIDEGMCIVVNPTNGKGRKMRDLASFNNVILESDEQTIEEFMAAAEKLQIPMLAATFSGNRSVHAVARVDAKDNKEHAQRRRLYLEAFASLGITLDMAAMTASQVTRLPGIMRHGVEQKLLSVNPNAISFEQWQKLYEKATDEPRIQTPWTQVQSQTPPPRKPVLVEDMLRRGHIGLISGKAKLGKTWSAIQLAVAVATGGEWFGRKCEKGDVLFIDPEVDPASLDNRFNRVCEALDIDRAEVDRHVSRWSLRGTLTTDGLPPTIADIAHDITMSGQQFALVIIDSCSCFLCGEAGDENSSVAVRQFFSWVGRIAQSTGAAVFLVHHQGKGNVGDRDAADRARGSSVWVDAPDLILTLTELFPPQGKVEDYLQHGSRAVLLEDAGIREFGGFDPVHLVYKYPVHNVDKVGKTADWTPKSSASTGGKSSGMSRREKVVATRDKYAVILLSFCLRTGTNLEDLSCQDITNIIYGATSEHVSDTTLKRYFADPSAPLKADTREKGRNRWYLSLPAKT